MHNLSLYHTNQQSVDFDPLLEYMPLVKQVALHLSARLPASVDIDDLIQVGMMGFWSPCKIMTPAKVPSLRLLPSCGCVVPCWMKCAALVLCRAQ